MHARSLGFLQTFGLLPRAVSVPGAPLCSAPGWVPLARWAGRPSAWTGQRPLARQTFGLDRFRPEGAWEYSPGQSDSDAPGHADLGEAGRRSAGTDACAVARLPADLRPAAPCCLRSWGAALLCPRLGSFGPLGRQTFGLDRFRPEGAWEYSPGQSDSDAPGHADLGEAGRRSAGTDARAVARLPADLRPAVLCCLRSWGAALLCPRLGSSGPLGRQAFGLDWTTPVGPQNGTR
jgi:hypothetical protein